MENATRNQVLPTAPIGSLPRPGWHGQTAGGRPFRVAMADARYNEEYTDAVSSLVRDQERAGIDIITDGDNRLDPTVGGVAWALYPAERLAGTAATPVSRFAADKDRSTIIGEIDDVALAAAVVDRVGRGELQYRAIWQAAQRLTTRPVKFGTPSAEVIYHTLVDHHYGDGMSLVMDVAAALNEELLDVAQAGCSAVQIEAPWITRAAARVREDVWDPAVYYDIFVRTVHGLGELTEVWAHLCWGNSGGQLRRRGGRGADSATPGYGAAMELLNELPCDVITFENADSGSAHLDEICKGIKEKKVALGVVSHRTLQVESPDDIASVLRRALEHLPPERLVVTADCGFGREGISRRVAMHKMVSMVRGANLVRRELGLPERPILV